MVNESVVNDEQIEGMGDDAEATWGDYPIDTLLIRHETRTVHDILRRIEQKTFIMDPDFQRDFIWPDDKQSKLIESVLMRIPLPVMYLAEDDLGRMVVVDGLQRLSTFSRFVNNELKLKLPDRHDLNQKRFRDLSPKLQNRIEDCNLILYVIDSKVPDRARLDIFERVNSGVPLTRQQMRNCLYSGAATKFLKREAKQELFLSSTGGSLRTATMRDREFINRFCAFQVLGLQSYRGDMDDFLAKVLIKMNQFEITDLQVLSEQLKTGLTNNYLLFGEHAFRKSIGYQGRRSVINASLWDVLSTGLSKYPRELVLSKADQLKCLVRDLLDYDQFNDAITSGTNDMKRVNNRFLLTQQAFEEVLK